MPPTPISATVKYNKKSAEDGTLVFPAKKDFLYWTPKSAAGGPPAVTVPIKDITNLAATPATAKAQALRATVEGGAHTFYFSARQELELFSDNVGAQIEKNKEKANALPLASGSGTPVQNGAVGEGKSAAMAMAKAVASKQEEKWYDDEQLIKDVRLQTKLLADSPTLKDFLTQAVAERPEGVSVGQVSNHFWRSRLHLLRQVAISEDQKQGVYHVLPEIKFVKVPPDPEKGRPEWTTNLDITKEQVHLLFKHHPLLRQAYDELTTAPKPLSSGDFWAQFFQSRLLKYLKGEKILDSDPRNPNFDKYIGYQLEHAGNPLQHAPVPNWLNLEGNEHNHSQKKGNAPDVDMRPSRTEKTPVLRILNTLSEKMMAHVALEDSEAHAPVGMDEETYDRLRLQDLAREDVDNRIVLNIREQQRYAGGSIEGLSAEAKLYAQQDPQKVLSSLRADLDPSHLGAGERGTLKLDQAIGYHTDDESDSEDEAPSDQTNGTAPKKKKVSVRIGSHAAMSSATTSILYSIKQRRQANSTDPNSLNGLSQSTFDSLRMTHSTTTEFIHYFWSVFLSGDATRADELAQLVSSLNNSMSRINAVAATAEAERQERLHAMKQEDAMYQERFGKKRYKAVHFERLGGGEKAVMEMVRPTIEAIRKAEGVYRKAYEEQTREREAAGAGAAAA